MNELNFFTLATFVLSLLIGWMVIPQIVLISKKKRLFDVLSDRKSHSGQVPRLGGVSFAPTMLLSLCFFIGLRYATGFGIDTSLEVSVFKDLMFLISGVMLLFFIGIADDLSELSYRIKLLAQLIAASFIIFTDNYITSLGGLFGIYGIPDFVGILLTILLIVFLTNAYNLIDGIDGLCSGLAMLTLLFFVWWFVWTKMYVYAMIAAAMLGVIVPFFYFNVGNKSLKIFMGDTGSLTLGYVLAVLGLKFYNMNTGDHSFIGGFEAAPAILLGVMFIPAFDTLRVFFERLSHGLSPFHPDKRHIHHKLLDLGFSHMHGTLTIIAVQALFILFNLLCRHMNPTLLFIINLSMGIIIMAWLNVLLKRKKKNSPVKIKTVKTAGNK